MQTRTESTVATIAQLIRSLKAELMRIYPSTRTLDDNVPSSEQLSVITRHINDNVSVDTYRRNSPADALTSAQAWINLMTCFERHLPLAKRLLQALDTENALLNLSSMLAGDWFASWVGLSPIASFKADQVLIRKNLDYLYFSDMPGSLVDMPTIEINHDSLSLWLLLQTHQELVWQELDWFFTDEGPMEKVIATTVPGITPALYRVQRDQFVHMAFESINTAIGDYLQALPSAKERAEELIYVLKNMTGSAEPILYDVHPVFNHFFASMDAVIYEAKLNINSEITKAISAAAKNQTAAALMENHRALVADIESLLQQARDIPWEIKTPEKACIIREQLDILQAAIALLALKQTHEVSEDVGMRYGP